MKTRTHHCNELNIEHIGENVVLAGWVDSIRDHGGVSFIDLRDRKGLTQIVLDPQNQAHSQALSQIKPESVIHVAGRVQARPAATVNTTRATGKIEVAGQTVTVLNVSKTPPFPLNDEQADKVQEELRLTYRYLDLRRPKNLNRLHLRHKAAQAVRAFLNEQEFTEVELPILFKSTPEGAREFLVPSRLNPGEFYALTQSPQQYKQMLMVAGVERYYSLAKCFRDEDLRADRQPEFTQIDMELSFIDREIMYALIEGLLRHIWKTILKIDIPTPFPRMPYQEAMDRYGVDKPDTRFGLEIQDLSSIFAKTQFKVFAEALETGGIIRAFNAKGLGDMTQGELKKLEDIAKTLGAKGLAYIKVTETEWKSPISKFLSENEMAQLKKVLQIEPGDVIFFAATDWQQACSILGRIRLECAQLLKARGSLVIDSNQYNFLWVTDFPLVVYDEELKTFASAHHPFTAPVAEDIHLIDTNPKAIRGQHYDIVLNGVELGGGSIRIHDPKLQEKVFKDVLGIPASVVEDRFGYMLKAFQYGTPPHGGIALGFDRLVATLAQTESIRDVIAFPKTQKGQDLMAQSPNKATGKQLQDLFIQSIAPER